MCGILGIISKDEIKTMEVIERLKRLEYRGYDSWGIAFKDFGDKDIKMIKKVGEISSSGFVGGKGNLFIAHTRWATHGKVNEINAHPHYSNKYYVYLVHNGIIENFTYLKKFLKEKGYVFYSDTDSEIIANLIEYNIERYHKGKKDKNSLVDAINKTIPLLQGSYALVIIFDDYLIGIAKESPLILGSNSNKMFFGSDVKSFVDISDKIYPLDDGDVVIVDKYLNITAYNCQNRKFFIPKMQTVDKDKYDVWEPLGTYSYYTLKEIEEEKFKLIDALVYSHKDILNVARLIKSSKGIFFVASGSSYNASLLASYVFSREAKIHVNVVDASEFEYYQHFIQSSTLIIAVSQSGETADVIESVKIAKNKGAKVVGITNTYGSTLYRICDVPLLTHVGSEISVIATKTYCSQVLLMLSLIYGLMNKPCIKDIDILKDALNKVINEDMKKKIEKIAYLLKGEEHLYIIGRGVNYAIALEGALKIKEVSYIHAEAFAGGALKHGSIALISSGVYVIAIAPEDESYCEIIGNVMEVKARGAKVIGITTKHNEIFDYEIIIPKHDMFQPLISVIPLQLLAYYLAVLKGMNPDKPRNLAKSVTVK